MHIIYQLYQYTTIKRNHQLCDWCVTSSVDLHSVFPHPNHFTRRCTYNITYIWFYLPWSFAISWTIKRQISLSQRIIFRVNRAQLLASYFWVAWLCWTLAIYTTTTQPHGIISKNTPGLVFWGIVHAGACCILAIPGVNFSWKALKWRKG